MNKHEHHFERLSDTTVFCISCGEFRLSPAPFTVFPIVGTIPYPNFVPYSSINTSGPPPRTPYVVTSAANTLRL